MLHKTDRILLDTRRLEKALSLVGNLEDLGLGDIFQIVSLSRRSGTLQLTTAVDSGEIVFDGGKVVAAYRTGQSSSVGEALLQKQLLSASQYQEVLGRQGNGRIGLELFEGFDVDCDAIAGCCDELVKDVVFNMFLWNEGTFSFVLEEKPDRHRGFMLDGTRAVSIGGINPQYLSIEGARLRDEHKKDDAFERFLEHQKDDAPRVLPIPADPKGQVLAQPKAEIQEEPAQRVAHTTNSLILIDDDGPLLKSLVESLGGLFSQCHSFENIDAFLESFNALAEEKPVVVSDLIIPRSDGKGILGGVQVLETVRRVLPDVPVFLYSDYHNEEADARARTLGVPGVYKKPRRAQIASDPNSVREFVRLLRHSIEPFAPSTKGEQSRVPIVEPGDIVVQKQKRALSGFDLGSELAEELGESEEVPADLPPAVNSGTEMAILRSMLAELVDPSNRETVTLLVLRYAASLMERGGLFLAARRVFVGLGGFSIDEASEDFVARVRKIRIPVDAPSVFSQVMKYRTMVVGPLPRTDGNEALIEGLGGGWPSGRTVTAPLVSGGRVAAILYGDNPSGRLLDATDTLEIFLQQAGLAMDRTLLERQLEEAKGPG